MADPIQTVEEITPQNEDAEAAMAERVAAAFQARGNADDTTDEVTPDTPSEEEISEEEDEETLEGDEEAPSTPATEEEPTPAEEVTPEEASIAIDGEEVPVANVRSALSIAQWMQSLPPEAAQGIDAFLSGQYILLPRAQYEQLTAQPSQQSSTTPAREDSTPTQEELDDLLDPKVAQYIRSLQSDLNDVRGQIGSQQQFQAQQVNTQYTNEVTAGLADFAASHELSENETNEIAQHVASLGTLPQYINASGGNTRQGTISALEQAYWAIPQYRDRAIQAQIQERIDSELETSQQRTTRKKKASALNGRTASVSRLTPKPSTPEDAKAQMVSELADAISTGQSV